MIADVTFVTQEQPPLVVGTAAPLTHRTVQTPPPLFQHHLRHLATQYQVVGRKEGNVLFNDTLNTFYLRLYGVRHMVKDHSDSEKGNPLPHSLLFPISSKVFFYMHHPTDRIAHTTAFVTPVVEHWLEREIAQWEVVGITVFHQE